MNFNLVFKPNILPTMLCLALDSKDGKFACGVFIDLHKAFDTVDHSSNACMWQHVCGSVCVCGGGGMQSGSMDGCVGRGRWGRWDMIWGSKVMGAWGKESDQIIIIKRLGMNNYDR